MGNKQILINYIVVGIMTGLITLSLSGMINGNANEKANKISNIRISELQEEVKRVSAPSKKLEGYVLNREEYMNIIEENENIINEAKSILNITDERKAISEKQIRCQRAVNVGMQEGDCNTESVYEIFSL